jgi:hypothetical protein
MPNLTTKTLDVSELIKGSETHIHIDKSLWFLCYVYSMVSGFLLCSMENGWWGVRGDHGNPTHG